MRSTTSPSASAPGGALGLVGELGSGKSTLSRLVCRLLDPDDGDIVFDGELIARIPAREFHKAPQRRDIQIVFQDPNDSLNPRYTAFDSIAHPLRRLEGLRDGAALADARARRRRRAPACRWICWSASPTSFPAARRRAWESPAPLRRARA